MKRIITPSLLLVLLAACHNTESNSSDEGASPANRTAALGYTVLQVYPHDTTSFTEGLEWHDSTLYESAGLNGQSKLVRVSLKDGRAIKKNVLGKEYFGEGITIFGNHIYQLTYREQKCFVYDIKTFAKTGEFNYEGQGWGMTHNDSSLIMDDSTNTLVFRDPKTFAVTKRVPVTGVPTLTDGSPASINELEFVDGFVYANVWLTNYLLKIDPATGNVVAQADFTDLYTRYISGTPGYDKVFNGIAYNSATKTFYVTGKNWPNLFEIKFN